MNSVRIFRISGFAFLLSVSAACTSISTTDSKPSTQMKTLVWSQPESKTRLNRSSSGDFFALASFFEPQSNKFSCGPTTGTILLNALFLKTASHAKPVDPTAYPLKENFIGGQFNPSFEKYTQNTFFDAKTEAVKSREIFYGKPKIDQTRDGGLTLAQFAKMLEIHGLKVETFYAESIYEFEKQKLKIIESLKDGSSYIAINFDRRILEQNGGGHISPLVAFDSQSDSFLVLDVNPVVTEWFWVRSQDLFQAMNSKDGPLNRGFLKISR